MSRSLLSFSVVCRVVAAILWMPALSQAVEFGELDIHSEWFEEFNLEVDLVAVVPADLATLSISLASRSEFFEAGIAYPKYADSLEFRILERADGTYYVAITTAIPVKEQTVHLLLSATWSRGTVVREYYVWLNPPLFMPDSAADVVLSSTVHVQPGDTLSGIVHSLNLPGSLTRFQGYTAILEANPDAFIEGNMNRLLAGAVLEIPAHDVISRTSPETALQQFLAQSEQYNRYLAEIGHFKQSGVGAGETEFQSDSGPEEEARLSIVQEVIEGELSAALEGESGDSGQISALERQSVQVEETLLSAEAQSDEIKEELAEMQAREEQVSTLIEIESSSPVILQDPAGPAENEPENVLVVPDEPDSQGTGESPAGEGEDADVAREEMAEVISPEPPDAGTDDGKAVYSQPVSEPVSEPASEPASEPVSEPISESVSEPVSEPASESVSESVSEVSESTSETVQGEAIAEDTSAKDAATEDVAKDLPEEDLSMVSEQAPPSSIMGSLSAMFGGLGDYVLKIIAGLLVLMAVLFFYRRRNSRQKSVVDEPADPHPGSRHPPEAGAAAGEESPSSSQTGRKGVVDEDRAISRPAADDPLAEAAVYLAYHREEQAIQVLEEAYHASPERHDLAEKLLEIFHQYNDRIAFNALAGELRMRMGESPDPVWDRVAAMGREISPENPEYDETDVPRDVPEPPDHQEEDSMLAVDDTRLSTIDEPSTGEVDPYEKSRIALELAETYARLGEKHIAKGYIHEVLHEGSGKQRKEAEKIAKKWEV